jgi:hypothetical protein
LFHSWLRKLALDLGDDPEWVKRVSGAHHVATPKLAVLAVLVVKYADFDDQIDLFQAPIKGTTLYTHFSSQGINPSRQKVNLSEQDSGRSALHILARHVVMLLNPPSKRHVLERPENRSGKPYKLEETHTRLLFSILITSASRFLLFRPTRLIFRSFQSIRPSFHSFQLFLS